MKYMAGPKLRQQAIQRTKERIIKQSKVQNNHVVVDNERAILQKLERAGG